MTAVASCSTNLLAAPIPERVVRFDNECILIPECHGRSKRPIVSMVTKSYALPLWKRKSPSPSPLDEKERDTEMIEDSDSSPEGIVFKVSVPSFKTRPSRGRSHTAEPLTPCLVHRSAANQTQHSPPPSFPSPRPRTLMRSPSLPIPPAKRITTVPLRACCPNCYPITEKSLKEGDNWETKFSTGARRRRSTSLDGITAPFSLADVEEALFRVNVTVDEVDTLKHRRSQEVAPEPVPTPHVEVEDEDQLFPLPLPRRSPNDSPIPSPKASPTCFLTAKNVSEECIIGKSMSRKKDQRIPEAVYPSRESSRSSSSLSLGSHAMREESIIGKSISRRNPYERTSLTAYASREGSRSSSNLSLGSQAILHTRERPSPPSSPSSRPTPSKHRRLMSDTAMFSSPPRAPPSRPLPPSYSHSPSRPTPKRSWSAVFKGVVATS
ncbi:hypothetical protein IW261DRAFT_1496330 [Armillaria novae-zelandiae]|uniref:Uncharacterized protein n=1 Tax=Armillaria novae-zelandiae TaxID=153914 RepID=A0AA39P0C4_9AGAR|nr:hypothetical protein IW261DRAFT_1496330 [Armillaria novae-zelandiae]